MVFFKQQKGSPWINYFGEAESWVNEEENKRLNADNIERPNTKWTFIKFSSIEVKALLDNQPMLGTGPLPDWLRNLSHGRNMFSLDTFADNLCLWRCIAVHEGARPDRCTQAAKQLGKRFFQSAFVPRTSLDELDKVEAYLNKGKQLFEWVGIRVYEPECQHNGEIDKLKNIMTIGIYEVHAFLIKDITKLAKTYVCNNCRARFTQATPLQRHLKTCAQGRTIVDCPNEKVKAPLTAYERTFYDEGRASQLAISWLEKTSKSLGIHIHHAMCGHGGERWILGAPVDGYASRSETIFQYHGCRWHGCRRCFPDRNTKICHGKTREQLYIETVQRTQKLREAVVEWCDQVPVQGFNCGRYDLNLIKEHFAELLADTTGKVQVAKKANTTMFMKTNDFIFLDIINYAGPGTSYDTW